jgi:hypothetical protein
MSEHRLQTVRIASRRCGKIIDLVSTGSNVFGNPQRRNDMNAPRRAEIAQRPKVSSFWL